MDVTSFLQSLLFGAKKQAQPQVNQNINPSSVGQSMNYPQLNGRQDSVVQTPQSHSAALNTLLDVRSLNVDVPAYLQYQVDPSNGQRSIYNYQTKQYSSPVPQQLPDHSVYQPSYGPNVVTASPVRGHGLLQVLTSGRQGRA